MQRVSHYSFFLKWGMPAFWCLLCAWFAGLGGMFTWIGTPGGPFLIGWACLMLVTGLAVGRFLRGNLMDEVWDCGDALLVRNRGDEERLPLADIQRAEFIRSRPPIITLTLRQPCRFGARITFCPPPGRLFQRTPDYVKELIDRIAAANRP